MLEVSHPLHCHPVYKFGPVVEVVFEDFVETVLMAMLYLVVVIQDLLNGCREKVARVYYKMFRSPTWPKQEYNFATCKAEPRWNHLL